MKTNKIFMRNILKILLLCSLLIWKNRQVFLSPFYFEDKLLRQFKDNNIWKYFLSCIFLNYSNSSYFSCSSYVTDLRRLYSWSFRSVASTRGLTFSTLIGFTPICSHQCRRCCNLRRYSRVMASTYHTGPLKKIYPTR